MDASSTPNLQTFNSNQKMSEKAGNSWSTHDRACTHCRERKIRCGREKPQCANCERDGVECGYYPPGKRVNHIKLLCNNVRSLEDRLSSIEGELSRLTTLLKADAADRSANSSDEAETSLAQTFPPNCQDLKDRTLSEPADRHVVRNQNDLTDRYHGPCTLFSLCKEISGILLSDPLIQSQIPSKEDEPARFQQSQAVKDVLSSMCLDAGMDEPFDFRADYVQISLPPKQVLLMVIPQFFEQVDYATDIFIRSSFVSNLDRIYSQHLTPANEAWAICFNAIILLTMGPGTSNQGNDTLAGCQFSQQFLLAVRTALSNPQLLMAPSLINIQALILLSIAAQQYYSPGIASSIFAQACILARIMGLHQLLSASDALSQEEVQERLKVVRSLYLRDKSFSLSRGSICWLPTADCTLSLEFERDESEISYCSRIQLAALQEEIFRLLYSAGSQRQSTVARTTGLARIEKSLERWAGTHGIFTSPLTPADTNLELEFFATRISALRGSSEIHQIQQALNDARASCLLLLMSYGKLEQSTIGRFEALPPTRYPARFSGKAVNSRPRKRKISDNGRANSAGNEGGCRFDTTGFHSLLEAFSVPGFFLLVKNIIWTMSETNKSQAEEDMDLLERVCGCYREHGDINQAEAYTHKVGRVITRLLQIVHLLRSRHQPQMSPHATQHAGETSRATGTSNVVVGQQGVPELTDLSGPSAYLTKEGFSSTIPSLTSPDTTTTDTSPAFLTSLESEYMSQWCDPARHYSFSPLFQQNPVPFPSRKRQRLSEPDLSVAGSTADPTSLTEFLNSAPMMPF